MALMIKSHIAQDANTAKRAPCLPARFPAPITRQGNTSASCVRNAQSATMSATPKSGGYARSFALPTACSPVYGSIWVVLGSLGPRATSFERGDGRCEGSFFSRRHLAWPGHLQSLPADLPLRTQQSSRREAGEPPGTSSESPGCFQSPFRTPRRGCRPRTRSGRVRRCRRSRARRVGHHCGGGGRTRFRCQSE